MLRRSLLAATCLTTAVLATACGQRTGVVRLAPGTDARALTFVLAADSTGVPLPPLDAFTIDGGPLQPRGRGSGLRGYTWYLARARPADGLPPVLRVRYGVVPPGMVEAAPAPPLLPGRYAVQVRAGRYRAHMELLVAADGRVDVPGQPTSR